MTHQHPANRLDVIIIGGGQAGLAMGYWLAKAGLSFTILDAGERIGDAWRKRWDSLRLFTPAKYSSLPGMRFPAPRNSFPSKDAMGDYLEQYAHRFHLPVQNRVRVDALSKEGELYIVQSGDRRWEAEQVVVAMSNYQFPKTPAFAGTLDPGIVQIHSLDYKNPSQLQEGPVLVVGAGNSGAEIALELAPTHKVWLAGRDTGHIPFDIESKAATRLFVGIVIRFLFYRVLTTSTPIGRKARPKVISNGGPLIRYKPKQFPIAGIQRIPRITGVKDGKPVPAGGEPLDIRNVVWCTGSFPRFSWIDLPVFREGQPMQDRGVVDSQPGLYFLGLHFLYALSSAMIHGVGRDARYIARQILKRRRETARPMNGQDTLSEKRAAAVAAGH